jgi:pimeloyl-ACP methyl ester carboxylesterase
MKFLVCLVATTAAAGCGAASNGPPKLLVACSDRDPGTYGTSDFYTLPQDLPAFDASHRGDVFKCDNLDSFAPADVNALLADSDYTGAPVTAPFTTYRIAYRTERATPADATAPVEGDSAALLLVPEKPNNLPLVVFAHGSVGIAESCAPSRHDLRAAPTDGYNFDYIVSMLALAGHGFTVIAPDYAGFAYGQPPGYFSAADEAHAVLDATRAAAQVLPPERRPGKVVLMGHSQGGHAVLSAQALAGSYGVAGDLVGVAAFAPYWISMAAYAAVSSLLATTQFTTTDNSRVILFSSMYFYSSSGLLDGIDHRLDVFASDKRAAVEKVLRGGPCYDTAGLEQLGRTAYSFFDSTFSSEVGADCAIDGQCTTPLSAKWRARMEANRPLLDPAGAKVLIWNGGTDLFISPGYAQCGRDHMAANGALDAVVTNCYDATLGHNNIIRRSPSDFVHEWIANVAGAGAAPAACTPFPTDLTCTEPPKNF